jgi:hypothetical protein
VPVPQEQLDEYCYRKYAGQFGACVVALPLCSSVMNAFANRSSEKAVPNSSNRGCEQRDSTVPQRCEPCVLLLLRLLPLTPQHQV